MTNTINNNVTVAEIRDVVEKQSANTKESRGSTETHVKTGVDQVTLTSDARQLSDLIKTAASEPDVDTAKVSAIRDAIGRGEYQVDSARIAERMVGFEKLFRP